MRCTLTLSGYTVYHTPPKPGLGELRSPSLLKADTSGVSSGFVAMRADDEPVNQMLFRAEFGADFKWHVLHVRSRQEKILVDEMRRRDVQCFLPLVSRIRFYAGRKAIVEAPLFPGYVFLRGSLDDAYVADRSKRLAGIIPVLDQHKLNWELQNIHRALGSGQELDPFPALQRGVRVRVTAGPLLGLEGIVEDRSRADRIVVQIDMLGQAVSLELHGAQLETI